jgi:hypothetical protein
VGRFIDRLFALETMAKSDAFFIRANLLHTTATGYQTTEIDLGSFVNLGVSKSTILRIWNIEVALQDNTNYEKGPRGDGANDDLNVRWQLCTQPASDLVLVSDKSLIASGSYFTAQTSSQVTFRDNVIDVGPQKWEKGYLVAVDALELGADMDDTTTNGYNVSIVMECTLETATQASSTALALSQQ